ncbi:MAG: response regulator, partial [Desulfobulbaceae bacterium]|nr:response regulator [Desulfobulbaceae bacterium]
FTSGSGHLAPGTAKVLYVDDEPVNLSNFSFVFENDFKVLTASSGEEALKIFRQEKDIAIVIADQRMPGMNGVELLERLRNYDPETIRIILTGYTDADDIVDAINRGNVYQYILKPWREDPLRITLQRALETHTLQKENRLLSRRLLQVAEDEQKRIARNLHDDFGQVLPTLRYSVEKIRKSYKEITPELAQEFTNINNIIEKIGDISREVASALRPDILDRMGLMATMEWMIKEYISRHPGIDFQFEVIGEEKPFPPEVETTLFRIFQEACNNIDKHAQATQIEVVMTFMHPHVILTIRDNGVGFDPQKPMADRTDGSGVGLRGMRERVGSVSGTLTIRSKLGLGTIIRAEVPLHEGLKL